jgi:hypothetical protein
MPAEAEQAFRAFLLAAIGRVPDPITDMEYMVELATGLEAGELERRMQEWQTLIPRHCPDTRWEISLYSYYQLSPLPSR